MLAQTVTTAAFDPAGQAVSTFTDSWPLLKDLITSLAPLAIGAGLVLLAYRVVASWLGVKQSQYRAGKYGDVYHDRDSFWSVGEHTYDSGTELFEGVDKNGRAYFRAHGSKRRRYFDNEDAALSYAHGRRKRISAGHS